MVFCLDIYNGKRRKKQIDNQEWLKNENKKRPLSTNEIIALSECRRNDYINNRFVVHRVSLNINVDYRGSLSSEGRWDKISLNYNDIYSAITKLLQYKRHEWSVWVLTNEDESKYLWANKGDDNQSTYFKGDFSTLIMLALGSSCNTVIHFHNHPHTQDRYWNLLQPSDTDIETFNEIKNIFNDCGLNYIAGIASQGYFKIYGQCFSENYIPEGCSVEEIKAQNNLSRQSNYDLRKELDEKGKITINALD